MSGDNGAKFFTQFKWSIIYKMQGGQISYLSHQLWFVPIPQFTILLTINKQRG
jgi:hypothetical protein